MVRNSFPLQRVVVILVCGCGAISASGCGATMTQTEIKMLETREMDLSFDEAYQASMNGLFSLGYTIEHSDKASGVVTGKRNDPNSGGKVGAALALGVIGLLAVGDKNEAVTFKLAKLEEKVTQLRMKLVINGKPVVDRTVMTKIWQQIEREAMLESRPSDRNPASPGSTSAPTNR